MVTTTTTTTISKPELDIPNWPVIDTDWMDDTEGWDRPVGPPNPKLSELIRLGSRGRRQIRQLTIDPVTGDVCALGAAMVAARGPDCRHWGTSPSVAFLEEAFGLPLKKTHYGDKGLMLYDEVIYMNDRMHFTFDVIIRWLQMQGL